MTSQSHRACLKPIIDGGKIIADHNDPNAVNSIFSDIDVSAADLYDLFGFPSDDTDGGEKVVIALTFASIPEAGGHGIKTYIGGRDDAFFNDLTGFFRSINYAPQFYYVPHTAAASLRELKIPKTLLELEGNDLFNFDP